MKPGRSTLSNRRLELDNGGSFRSPVHPMAHALIIVESPAKARTISRFLGDDFIVELLDSYFEDCPGLMGQMHQALDSADAVAFRRASHALQSTSASLGAIQFSALAHRLEVLCKEDRLEQAQPYYND